MLTLLLTLLTALQANPAPQAPAAAGAEADKAAILETVLNYADGYYEGSAERMAKAVHPLLSKRSLMPAQEGGPSRLSTMNSEMLIEIARAGRGKLPPEQRGVKAEVLDVAGNLATARVFTAQFNDYLHLLRTENGWRILNVLWRPPAKTTTEPDKVALSVASRDYLAAMAGRNGEAVRAMLHPAVSFRVIGPAPASSRLIVQDALADYVGDLVEAGRMPLPPEAGGTGTVTVLDAYEDIAAVKLSAGPFLQYAHLGRLAGRWRVINTLTFVQPPPK